MVGRAPLVAARLSQGCLPLLQAMALHDVCKQVGRVPVVFDPYYALSPTAQAFDSRDGRLNVYERYQLSIA